MEEVEVEVEFHVMHAWAAKWWSRPEEWKPVHLRVVCQQWFYRSPDGSCDDGCETVRIGVCYGVWMGSWVPQFSMRVCLCGVLESERSPSPYNFYYW